jgi:hypothetical protein
MIQRLNRFVWLLWLGGFALPSAQAQNPSPQTQQTNVAALQAEMDQAMERVRQIVNQPVTRYARQAGMRVRISKDGWFHPGARRPNFNTVDVRNTQEKPYDQFPYITSDLNPGVVFAGPQLEFNVQLKFFYTDHSLPKKKLTETEMLEINRLYRIIGRCEQQISEIQGTAPAEDSDALVETETLVRVPVPRSRCIKGGIALAAVLVLYVGYKRIARKRRA